MAAPTVGAVMADILPYLGVARNYTQEDLAGQEILVEDIRGMARKQTEKVLKEKGLGCLFIGEGDTVTGQIPASGQILPGGSQVLAYLGEPVPEQKVSVPDFTGLNRQQAADLAGRLGLHILVTGNQEISQHVVAVQQDIQKDTAVAVGTTIRLRFSDNSARD